MSDYSRIEKHIRDAGVQRSAALGIALGEWLADAWLGAARAGARLGETLARRPPQHSGAAPSR